MQPQLIPYHDGATSLEGLLYNSSKEASTHKKPLVLLCHAWKGRDPFIEEKAQILAEYGYASFAIDMYGKGILGKTPEECIQLKAPFIEDRSLLQRRILKAYEIARSLPYIDPDRIAVMGFGFGGICALDLARSGVHLKAAITFYGHFQSPPKELIKPIQAKILVLHGYNDPITPSAEIEEFEREMNEAKVDWQVHLFGNTYHAFPTPGSTDTSSGIAYNPLSAKRAWLLAKLFLDEVL